MIKATKEWLEPPDIPVPAKLRAIVDGHPLVAKILVRRGLNTVEKVKAFIDPHSYQPASPFELPNMAAAAARLEEAIRRGESICVWGDFDVDGQTSTTTLLSTLRDLGADVRYHIPTRDEGGHGVHIPALKRLIDEGVELLLTCDTGVSAHEAVEYAQAHGMEVVITDHHDLPPVLPPAQAVVNPKMLPDEHPLHELPGMGCAYKLAEALYERAGRAKEAERYLDLAAMGIVADVATQTDDTRYLLQRGLEALRHTERLGLQVLMEIAELTPEWLTEEHIGFELAPRLNALGRLADASAAVELFTTDDLERARILATELDGLNARRKLLCDQVIQTAEAQIEQDSSLLKERALVLSYPTWPAGVIGIVAGRLAEKYQRPTILISAPPDELARGSARSIPGCDISAAIAAQGKLLEGFGGHPMAAGLSIRAERIPAFRRAILKDEGDFLKPSEPEPLQIDGYLPLADLTLDLVEDLEQLAPFGPGNPPPTLASRNLALRSSTELGRTGEHLRLLVEDEAGVSQRVIWWRGAGSPLPQGPFDLAYTVRASDYRGQRRVKVEWIEARERGQIADSRLQVASRGLRVEDYRGHRERRGLLAQLRERDGVQVWSEGAADTTGRSRYELGAAPALVIWTSPPGPAELRAALEAAAPETVYLFGLNPSDQNRPQAFLRRLAGLVKRAINAGEGRVDILALAAATAQREATVRAGLEWLAAHGDVMLHEEDGETRIKVGDGNPKSDLSQATARLRALLEETRAYRTHFARADGERLIRRK